VQNPWQTRSQPCQSSDSMDVIWKQLCILSATVCSSCLVMLSAFYRSSLQHCCSLLLDSICY
jgi:hypothetical protein